MHRYSAVLTTLQPAGSTGMEQYITPLLEFWDGICCLFSARKVPSAWTGVLLKALKPFPPETRSRAAADAQVCMLIAKAGHALSLPLIEPGKDAGSEPECLSVQVTSQAMHKAAGLWAALKPAALTPLFEIAEVEDAGRATKRPRR